MYVPQLPKLRRMHCVEDIATGSDSRPKVLVTYGRPHLHDHYSNDGREFFNSLFVVF